MYLFVYASDMWRSLRINNDEPRGVTQTLKSYRTSKTPGIIYFTYHDRCNQIFVREPNVYISYIEAQTPP